MKLYFVIYHYISACLKNNIEAMFELTDKDRNLN